MAFYQVRLVKFDGYTFCEDYDSLEDALCYFLESQADVGRFCEVSLHFFF